MAINKDESTGSDKKTNSSIQRRIISIYVDVGHYFHMYNSQTALVISSFDYHNMLPILNKFFSFSGAEASVSSRFRPQKPWIEFFQFLLTPSMERRSTRSTQPRSQNRRPTKQKRFSSAESVRKRRRMRSRRISTNLVSAVRFSDNVVGSM